MDAIAAEARRKSHKSAMRDASRLQHAVLLALERRGPHTTRALADVMQITLLTVRPRMTELLQAGLVKTVGRNKHGAIYQAVTAEEYDAAVRALAPPDDAQMRLF